ncbi:RHS repeat-associated core domain-containing protein, partial [Candidatus Neomicrothrix sp.]|uniref:RHS repeat-associated core domain-containing protein n=1 Tax=Candidatus Neomicrothrix sp. TaxID=2719034 RepID=UPI001B5F4D9D
MVQRFAGDGVAVQEAQYDAAGRRWSLVSAAQGGQPLLTLRDGAGQARAEYVVRPGAGPELSREYVYGNGRLMAIESACGPRPRLELASPAQQGTQVLFRKTDFVDPVGEYAILIETDFGQRKVLSRPASLADEFGIEQEEFFPGVTNRVTLQARAACGATGYSNAVSYGRDPGLPGCLEDMAVFYANLAPDGSGDLTPRSPSSGAGCPPGTSFNLYYRRPGIATVRLNAQALATPAFVIADQPAGAGHGEYWYVPLDPVTQQEGPAGPLVTSDARNSTAGPEGLPGQPARNAQYVGWDHLGSTRLVLDEEGVSLGGWKYYPFGTEAESSGPAENRKRFTGHERDTDTALDYMLARYCSSSLSRFLSTDPVSTIKKNLRNPQRWNRYLYALNNPLTLLDPDGRDAITSVDWQNRTVNVTVNIVMVGPAASAQVATKYQQQANAIWGGGREFTAKSGEKWNLNVHANVTTDPSKMSPQERPNTITVSDSGKTEMTSPNAGTLNVNDLGRSGVAGHEQGHMMSLEHPAEDACTPGVMNPEGLSTEPTQEELDQLGNTAIESTEISKAPEPEKRKP